jgi:hypothetical protein
MNRLSPLFKRNSHRAVCAEREEDLLLYLHDELPTLRRLAVQWHLSGCAGCRAHLEQLTDVSQQFANVLREPSLPRWSPPIVAGSAQAFGSFSPPASSRFPALMGIFAVLVIVWSGISLTRAAAFYGYYGSYGSYYCDTNASLPEYSESTEPATCEMPETPNDNQTSKRIYVGRSATTRRASSRKVSAPAPVESHDAPRSNAVQPPAALPVMR